MSDTDGTDGTTPSGTASPWPPDIKERVEALTEAVATANLRTRRMAEEVAALRYVVIFALCLAGAFYVLTSKRGAVTP